MSKNIHESEKLEHLLGRWVRITFNDGDVRVGRLGKPYFSWGYCIDMEQGRFAFMKSHIRKVEVIS